MDVFDLQAKITLDSSGYERDLDKAAGHISSFAAEAEGFFKNIGAAISAAFAVDKVKDFVSGAVSEFARFEQLVGGVDTLFGDSSGKLQENADAAFRTAGMSANEYMDTATSFAASLIQALGGDTAAAVGMVDMAVVDMADNANKMGTDIGSIQHAYQGFAKQNYTMLDNLKLGYGGTKSEMARLINDTGILGDTIVEVSTMTKQGNFDQVVSFDVVVDAIHAVQEEMGITGTTAAEAAGTIEGSVTSMKAAWSNWLVGLGDPDADLAGLTDTLVSSFETAASNVIPVVGRIGESLTQVFTQITGIDLTPVTSVFETLKTSFADIGSAFAEGGIGGGFAEIARVFTDLTGIDLSGVTDTFTEISTAFSEIQTAFSEGGVSGGLDQIAKSFEDMTGLDISDVTDGIKKFAEVAGELKTAFENDGVSGVVDSLIQSFKDSTGIDLTGLVDGIKSFIESFKEIDPETFKKIADAVVLVLQNFNFEGLADLITAIADAMGKFFEKCGEALENGLPVVADIIRFMSEDFPNLASGVVGAATGIMMFVAAIKAMEIIKGVPAMLSGFKTALSGVFTLVSAHPFALLISALGALVTAFVTAYNTSEEFRDVVNSALNSVKETAQKVVEKISEVITKVGEFFSGAWTKVKGVAGNVLSFFGVGEDAGDDLAAGLESGVSSGISGREGRIKKSAGEVTEYFNEKFDRHSPSKVFAEIGRDLMRGLELGIAGEAGNVQRTIDGLRFEAPVIQTGRVDVAQSTMGKMSSAAINNAISLAGGSGGGQLVNVNLNVDGRTLATVLFDPLNNVIKQKGVTLGA